MISGDKKIILNEINTLKDTVFRLNSKDEIYSYVNSMNELLNLYYYVTGVREQNRLRKEVVLPDYYREITNEKIKKIGRKFASSFVENREFHEVFVSNILSIMEPTHSQFLKDENSLQFRFKHTKKNKLSEKERLELLLDFFQKEGREDEFRQFVSDKRIMLLKHFYRSTYGYLINNTFFNSFFIGINKSYKSYDVAYLSTIVHEFGHVLDIKNLDKSTNKKESFYARKSIFHETVSRRYEKKFLDFLISNDIFVSDAYLETLGYYNDLYSFLFDILFFTNFENQRSSFNKDNVSIILKKYPFLKSDILDEIDIANMDMKQSLIYGYSGSLAVYFNYLEKEDKKLYKKYYQEFLRQRKNYFNSDNFSKFMDQSILNEAISKDIESVVSLQKTLKKKNI